MYANENAWLFPRLSNIAARKKDNKQTNHANVLPLPTIFWDYRFQQQQHQQKQPQHPISWKGGKHKKKQVKIPLTSAASRSEEEAPRRSTSKCILTQPSSSTCWQVQDGLLATRQLSTATGEGIYLAQDKGIRKTFSTLFQAHKLYTDILCLGTTSTIPTDHSYDLLYRCRALARYIMLP